nr:hypothetical protein [Tanacetum cinerariifolium]
MYSTQAQQKALDDSLVALANRLKIRKFNLRLISTLKSKEPTLQVVLDALKLTPFYKAFEITADIPKIYMQELWVTNYIHHASLHFKMNGKSHTVNVENFRDMLQIFHKLPGKIFEDPPSEKEILSFIRDLGHTEEIKFLSDVNVKRMHQPWRLFVAIINKCLSGYGNTKEKQDVWHTAKDDPMFTMLRVISKHQTTQIYGAILPKQLTNQAMIESEAYKTYYAYATGKRLKVTTKVPKSGKKKLHAQGLETLSEIALSKAEQMKITTKRSRTQFYVSHASGLGAHEGTSFKPGVPDAPKYGSDDEQISWKSSDEDNDDEDTADDNVDDEDDDGQDDDNE